MLTGAVPGTDLIVGMPRRLYAACERLAYGQRRIAETVDRERPRRPSDLEARDEVLDVIREERRRRYWEYEREDERLYEETRAGYESGARLPWRELLDQETEVGVDAPQGYLEAATEDTYLAVNGRTNLTLPTV